MAQVKLDDITKRYDDVTAVQEMNLDIRDGEFVTFVGPSGCGKSTTMETIAGLTKPTEGQIHIGDKDVTTIPPKDRGVAMIFQNIALFPHMDVYDNVSFGLRLRDYDKEVIDERVTEALETVQMSGMEDRSPDELSGGQRQRVAIARAVVREPDVFLMDEPLANLDAKLRVHMRTELQRIHKALDTTTIYVTHDQAEAMTMSDRIAVMNQGELQQIDPPLTCYNEPANRFVASFIGSPSMNLVEGVYTGDTLETDHFTLDVSPIDELDTGDNITVGFRPEDVYLNQTTEVADALSDPILATVDVLEPMGDEIYVYLTFDEVDSELSDDFASTADNAARVGDELLMSVDPDADLEEDSSVEIVLDTSSIHVFDSNTGDAVVHGVRRQTAAQSVDKP